jgi:hypothetical protein
MLQQAKDSGRPIMQAETGSRFWNYQMVLDFEINPVDTSVVYISVGNLSNNVPNANVEITNQ